MHLSSEKQSEVLESTSKNTRYRGAETTSAGAMERTGKDSPEPGVGGGGTGDAESMTRPGSAVRSLGGRKQGR